MLLTFDRKWPQNLKCPSFLRSPVSMESSTFSMELQNCFEGKVTNNTITPMDATEYSGQIQDSPEERRGLFPGGVCIQGAVCIQGGSTFNGGWVAHPPTIIYYGIRLTSGHPTGMHSFLQQFLKKSNLNSLNKPRIPINLTNPASPRQLQWEAFIPKIFWSIV